MKTNPPQIGQHITVRGLLCVITKILPMGTLECESIHTDHAFRVTGLCF